MTETTAVAEKRKIAADIELVGQAFDGNPTTVRAVTSDDQKTFRLQIASQNGLNDELILRALTQFMAVELKGPVTPLEIIDQTEQWKRHALRHARRFGFGDDAEDIACEVVCRFLEGRGLHQTIEQAVIDVIRAEYGDLRSETHAARLSERNYQAIEDMQIPSAGQENLDWRHLIDGMKGVDRAIIVLTYMWGFQQKEIGYCIGVTESRVNQKLKEILRECEERLAKNG